MDINLAESCLNAEISGLEQLKKVIYTNNFKVVYNELFNSAKNPLSRIIMTGLGKNATIAQKISETMSSLGISSLYLSSAHYCHGDAGFISDYDILINLSRSGTTEEMLNLVDHLKNTRPYIKQVLIHCNADKPTGKCDYEIFTGNVSEGDRNNLAPTTTTTTLLCLMDIISVCLSDDIGFTKENFYKFHPGGALGRQLKEELK